MVTAVNKEITYRQIVGAVNDFVDVAKANSKKTWQGRIFGRLCPRVYDQIVKQGGAIVQREAAQCLAAINLIKPGIAVSGEATITTDELVKRVRNYYDAQTVVHPLTMSNALGAVLNAHGLVDDKTALELVKIPLQKRTRQ